jgi:hypothetical protein
MSNWRPNDLFSFLNAKKSFKNEQYASKSAIFIPKMINNREKMRYKLIIMEKCVKTGKKSSIFFHLMPATNIFC